MIKNQIFNEVLIKGMKTTENYNSYISIEVKQRKTQDEKKKIV